MGPNLRLPVDRNKKKKKMKLVQTLLITAIFFYTSMILPPDFIWYHLPYLIWFKIGRVVEFVDLKMMERILNIE